MRTLVSKDVFTRNYIEASGISREQFEQRYIVKCCNCNYAGCRGWQVNSNLEEALQRMGRDIMNADNDLFRDAGFADEEEFHRMVARADISTPEKLAKFKEWQYNDGTKAGLEKLSCPA